MTDILWRKTGKGVLTEDGCPILCDKCPCPEECYSWVHYAPGISTAEQKLNRLTLEVNGHSCEMVLSSTSFYDSTMMQFVDVISGAGGGRTGKGYSATFRSESSSYNGGYLYDAEIQFRVFEDMTSSSTGSYSGYHGKYLNLVQVSGIAHFYKFSTGEDILYYMSGNWRILTNAPISEGGSVEKGVPLPFDLAMTVEEGSYHAPSSMNLPGSLYAWDTTAYGTWIIGEARYDETVECDMYRIEE